MNKIVTREEWTEARKKLLEEEKAFTMQRDKLSIKRRSLPWVNVDKEYHFHSEKGIKSFSDLFEGKSQLIIYHFMYGPDWGNEGCKSCSFWADNFNNIILHIRQRDVNMLCVSSAPLSKFLPFKKKMGWVFEWVSSQDTTFNKDFQVTTFPDFGSEYNYEPRMTNNNQEWPGISVFYKDDEGNIYHTYSTYARGLEDLNLVYRFLDIVPRGRDEDDLAYGMEWVKHHYKY